MNRGETALGIGQATRLDLNGAMMNPDKEEHLEAIKQAAKTHALSEKTKKQ